MNREELPVCHCGTLERGARHPGCAIRFDPDRGEFYLKASGGDLVLRHCPRCAGRAPERLSVKELWANVTPEEASRLHKLISDLEYEDEVLVRLGPPTGSRKRLYYNGFSGTATIEIALESTGKVVVSFGGVYVGPPKTSVVANDLPGT